MPDIRIPMFDDKLHHRFKVLCVRLRTTMQNVVLELIEKWVCEQEQEEKEGEIR